MNKLGRKLLSIEEFREKVKNKTNGEFEVLDNEYKGSMTYHNFKHIKCGGEFKYYPDLLFRYKHCPCCAIPRMKSYETFKAEVRLATNDEIEIISTKYEGNKVPLLFRHKICGNEFWRTPTNLLEIAGCPCCKHKEKVIEQYSRGLSRFKEFLSTRLNDTIIFNDNEYINRDHNYDPITFHCTICDNDFTARVSNFIKTPKCPHCDPPRMSVAEKFIFNTLKELNINFKFQYIIPACRDQKPLPFDFAIFDSNDNISLLLEYDGVQHETTIDFFGGDKYYQNSKLHDEIKDTYCKNHNIPLYRISFESLLKNGLLNIINKNKE